MAIGGSDEKMEAVKIPSPGEDIAPLTRSFRVDLAIDEVGERLDTLAGAAAEEGFRSKVEFEFDECVGGDADEQEVCEEPEEDFRGKWKPGAHRVYSLSGSMRR
jgi:hypothetical protein